MAIEALILRYSDVEAATLGEHLEVLSTTRHSVWWGWWRKTHEELPIEILQQAASQDDVRVGLINRRDGHFARAVCSEIRFSPEGAAIPSPDAEATPSYYATDAFPAWFRFTEIERLESEEEWNSQFFDVGIPREDQTLYWIEDGELRFLADDTPARAADIAAIPTIKTPGNRILHLSDIHYGEDHGFPLAEDNGRGPEQPTMVDAIAARIEQLGGDVGVVIVSGDLTTKSEANPLMINAQPELERLMDLLGLEVEHLVIVPGNHDIPLDDADEVTRHYRHERPFRSFLSALHGVRNPDIERLTMFDTPSGWKINTATLNSVRLRSAETKDYGYVGPRAAPLMKDLAERFGGRSTTELWQEKVLNITVLHHHLVTGELVTNPAEGHPVSVTLDAGKLISQLQEGAVHAVLHGHQHVPFLGAVARGHKIGTGGWDGYRRPLWLIGGGSAGVRPARLSNEMRDNCFGLYRPTEEGLEVQMELFNPGREGETFLKSVIGPS